MCLLSRLLGLVLIGILLPSCSGTKTTGSWTNQNYTGQVKNVYLIGIARNESTRKIFEDVFKQGLAAKGVKAVTSYNDLPKERTTTSREAIIQRMKINNCDSVLLTRLIGKRTVASISGGSGGSSAGLVATGGSSGGLVATTTRPSYYNNWNSYYTQSGTVYVRPPPAESVDVVLLTVESVLYDLQTEELIWSAQFETYFESNIEKMIQLFVQEATNDLKGKGLI